VRGALALSKTTAFAVFVTTAVCVRTAVFAKRMGAYASKQPKWIKPRYMQTVLL